MLYDRRGEITNISLQTFNLNIMTTKMLSLLSIIQVLCITFSQVLERNTTINLKQFRREKIMYCGSDKVTRYQLKQINIYMGTCISLAWRT